MYEHNALGYRSGLALCLTKVRSSRARCPATALIMLVPGGLQSLIISTCFAGHPVTSINISHALTVCLHENCYINTWLSFH